MAEDRNAKLMELYQQRQKLTQQMADLMHESRAMAVDNYELQDVDGNKTTLADVLGDHDKLVLIHNMGKHCPYCTMWADGLNGLYKYVEQGFDGTAARFILVNNDDPETIREFAASRGWDFDCYSCKGTSLFMDMGFANESEGKTYFHPGFSTILKGEEGSLRRHSADSFGPGDSYCGVWHFYDHLPKEEAESA